MPENGSKIEGFTGTQPPQQKCRKPEPPAHSPASKAESPSPLPRFRRLLRSANKWSANNM